MTPDLLTEGRVVGWGAWVGPVGAPEAWMRDWRALFDADVVWARHDASFYACWLAVVSDRVGPDRVEALRSALERVFGVPLAPGCHVTIQRMEPGDGADPHTDAPKPGYEAVRLIVHFGRGWSEADGGRFSVVGGEGGLWPEWGHGAAFVLGEGSWHSVQTTCRTRRSIVFNFWHVANTPDVGAAVDAALLGARFGTGAPEVAGALDFLTATAPEEHATRAGYVAWVLERWGCPPARVVAAIEAVGAGEVPTDPIGDLAEWVVGLRLDGFDAGRWAARQERWADLGELARVYRGAARA